MKELTIEEKAKRYDEAIERAKGMYKEGMMPERIEYIFPELAENEDERMRKDIISFVEQAIDAGYGIIDKERKDKWIAWLEKQCEQKPIIVPKFRAGDTIHKIGENTTYPRTVEKIEDDDYVCDNGKCFVNIKFQDDYELVEQKPVESESFEIEHGKYYYCIHDYYSGGNKRASKGDVVQALRGMSMMALGDKAGEYFLPVNHIEQKTVEWSEKDEDVCSKIIETIIHVKDNRNGKPRAHYTDSLLDEFVDWLKSLKPQPRQNIDEQSIPSREFILNVWMLGNEWKYVTKGVCNTKHGTQLEYIQKHWKEGDYYEKIKSNNWKPSDEQMEALKLASDKDWDIDGNSPLYTLYNDLKKLM